MRAIRAVAVGIALACAAPAVDAQTAATPRRIGVLGGGTPETAPQLAFEKGLREHGWTPGNNVQIEYRHASAQHERLPALADELVRMDVDVLVVHATRATAAAMKATSAIPIVMVSVGDPVEAGIVKSLARPGGNVTGVAFSVGSETFGKSLQILKDVIPGARRVAVLSNPRNPAQPVSLANVRKAAGALGLAVVPVEARSREEIGPAFAAIAKERPDALLVIAEALFIQQRDEVAALAIKHRVPTMHGVRENVVAGGLLGYGPDLARNAYRAAAFVDRILKGAKPADLPVEQPTAFELVVNLTTAKALGITVPASVLGRADLVVP